MSDDIIRGIEEAAVEQTADAVPPSPAFLNRNYVLLLQGQFISRLGTVVCSIVMLLWIKESTGSASLMGLLAMLTSIPPIILGVIGGTVADRYSRRKIIAYCDIVSGFAELGLFGLFLFFPDRIEFVAAGIIAASVFVSAADEFSTPAITAAVPDLVPRDRIPRANMLGQLAAQISTFFGQGMGGVLFRVVGAPAVALFTSVVYFYAGITESLARVPQRLPERSATWHERIGAFWKDTRRGIDYVRHNTGLKHLLFASSLLTFFASPLLLLIPYYVTNVLKMPLDWVGFLSAAYGVGVLSGYLTAGFLQLKGSVRVRAMILCMMAEPLGFSLLALSSLPALALTLAFLGGICSGFTGVYMLAIIQASTPSETRGRIFAVASTLSAGLAPAGMGLGGIIFDAIGQNVTIMYLCCSAIIVACIAVLSVSREFRTFLALERQNSIVSTHH